MTAVPTALPVLDDDELAGVTEELTADATLLVGSAVDMAGVARSKAVPVARAAAFHRIGMGASPSWNVFCIDNAVAMTERAGVVGDVRLRADLLAAHRLDEDVVWAPTEMFDQYGAPWPACARGRLRRAVVDAQSRGLDVLVGHELEFVLTAGDGTLLPADRWQAYGMGALLGFETVLCDLARALQDAGVPVEQLHSEYANYQFEVSLSPTDPLSAADHAVLTRVVVGAVARRHGLLASFSPLPQAGGAGNGAHQHVSLLRGGQPVFSGGRGPHGLTDEGQQAIAGLVSALPELLAVFAGSLLSSHRLQPGRWSGAFACWGGENREAAVRFCAATPGNPHGANVELKCIDPSANPYLATATQIGAMVHGIAERLPLPREVTVDPARLDPSAAAAANVVRLAATQAAALDLLQASPLADAILGPDILDALLAVRRHELDTYDGPPDELAERFRFAWSS